MHHQVHRTTTTFALVFAVITFLSIASTASALVTTFTPTMQEATVAATGSAATATTATVSRQPTYYISHGGGTTPVLPRLVELRTLTSPLPVCVNQTPGPCFFLKPQDQMSPDMGPDGPMAEALKGLLTSLKTKPDAILIISAHWESKGKAVSVTTQEKPGLLFDYYGTKTPTSKQRRTAAAIGSHLVAPHTHSDQAFQSTHTTSSGQRQAIPSWPSRCRSCSKPRALPAMAMQSETLTTACSCPCC